MYFQINYYISEVLTELPGGLLLIFTLLLRRTAVLHSSVIYFIEVAHHPQKAFYTQEIVSFLSMKIRSRYFISGFTSTVHLPCGACILNEFSLVVVLIAR